MADNKKRANGSSSKKPVSSSKTSSKTQKNVKNSKPQTKIKVDRSELVRWGIGFFAFLMPVSVFTVISRNADR